MMQVLLVTGGWSDDGLLDSTEVLEAGRTTWRLTGQLPSPREDLGSAVLDNKIFVFGENILCYIIISLNISLYLNMIYII